MKPNYYKDLMDDIGKHGYDDWEVFMRDMYLKKRMSLSKIGKLVHKDPMTIQKYMYRLGVPLRDRGGKNHVTYPMETMDVRCKLCGEHYPGDTYTDFRRWMRSHREDCHEK